MKMIEGLPIEQLVVRLPFLAFFITRRPAIYAPLYMGSVPTSCISRVIATGHQHRSPKAARSGVLEARHH